MIVPLWDVQLRVCGRDKGRKRGEEINEVKKKLKKEKNFCFYDSNRKQDLPFQKLMLPPLGYECFGF